MHHHCLSAAVYVDNTLVFGKIDAWILWYKRESRLRDSPPAAGRFSDIIPYRRSATLPGGLFYIIGSLSYDIKKATAQAIAFHIILTIQPIAPPLYSESMQPLRLHPNE